MRVVDRITLPATLAIILTCSVVALAIFFAINPPNPTNQILNTMVNTLTTVLVMVFSFFFGSSKGSEKKDDAMISGAISPTPVAPAPGTTTTTTTSAYVDVPPSTAPAPAPATILLLIQPYVGQVLLWWALMHSPFPLSKL